ncbi:calcineurin-like phosphoesterase family protein [Hyphomicrobium sp.]|uniref:calcineurin-like phosphoesterase family protein n=1 Tax=Hyphomicrobium sp. TaxID=82 RepID=UPI002E367BE8|nr:calcineurin-like phosphoesterase family protein [Hyphomicrobium sp.]HEX2841738.1 calcineurin-like phosphoesterase family protein [Hyphomicrobium sp.]
MAGASAIAAAGLFSQRLHGAINTASSVASGTVFEDRSGTGVRQLGDRGVAGVMVSNGRDVVLTDSEGGFALAVEPGESVFVIKPPHWSVSPQADNCSPSSYLHRSDVILSPSIDFPLRRTPEPAAFEALLFADVQPSNAAELGYFADLLRRGVHGTAAAFAINHGDVMGDDLSLFPAYRRVIGETSIPWHHCPGNHDMNLDSLGPHHAFETWKREIGPTHSAFRYAGATFILLNNVEYAGHGRSFQGGRGYRGLIGERQLAFVENVLRHVPADDLIVLSMHIPLVSFEAPDSISDTTADRDALMRLLAGRPHTVSFAGHSHTTEHHFLGAEHGFGGERPHHHHVLTAACGSWWSGAEDQNGIPVSDSRDGSPKGYHVLSVNGAEYTTRFVPFDPLASPQMRVMVSEASHLTRQDDGTPKILDKVVSSPVGAAHLSSLALVVDVFDGGPTTRVFYEIEGSGLAPVEMVRARTADPFIVESFQRDHQLLKSWVKPAVSSHIWASPLDRALATGSYRIVVRATLGGGATHTDALMLDVVA